MIAASPIARVKIEVTKQMIDAARDNATIFWEVPDVVIAEIYRRMRALEPGEHVGVAELQAWKGGR
jgi:hypothetical protein